MFWTVVWFAVNSLFVISLITYLFIHRSYTEARDRSADPERVAQIIRRRKAVGLLSILLLVLMAASFLINMRING